MLTVDFETRSACDLRKAGAFAYSEHPTTQVMCLAYCLGEDDEPRLWHRGHDPRLYPEPLWPLLDDDPVAESPPPEDLIEAIRSGAPLEAHNAGFERSVWRNTLRREFPWFPEVDDGKWHCSAAKAANFALPRALDGAALALHLTEKKDAEGHALMQRVSKPRKIRKAEVAALREAGLDPEAVLLWWEQPEQLQRLWDYCLQDVRTERALSRSLRDLTPIEREFWLMDQRMNSRGVNLDLALTNKALSLASDAIDRMNDEVRRITHGEVPKGSSRPKLKAWVNKRGAGIENTQGDTLEEALKRVDLEPRVRRVLEICRDVNRTSTAKYKQALRQVSSDGRIRDLMLYCGAERTRRWAGKGLQPHNFVRGYSKEMDQVCEDILYGDLDTLEALWGNPMEVLAKATRGILVPAEGRDLIVADFSAIEARVLVWLAGDERALALFHRGEDVYIDLAQDIYRRPINKRDNPTERQVGKTGILGLGFGMGWPKFGLECVKNGVPQTDEFLKEIVRIYRKKKYPLVEQYWHDLEEAALEAVRTGDTIEHRKLKWGIRGRFLHCRLPSGGLLSYFRPALRRRTTFTYEATDLEGLGREVPVRVSVNEGVRAGVAYGRARKYAEESKLRLVTSEPSSVRTSEVLTYLAPDNKTGKLRREDTYGGKLTENVTQATARELLAEAMLRADKTEEYDVLLSVHDELVCEVDEGVGDLGEFEALMSILPEWADGCPVTAEGWRGKRYKKG